MRSARSCASSSKRDGWPERETRLLDGVPGAGEITPRAAILLAWLQHLGGKGRRAFASDVWMTHNVHRVLEHV